MPDSACVVIFYQCYFITFQQQLFSAIIVYLIIHSCFMYFIRQTLIISQHIKVFFYHVTTMWHLEKRSKYDSHLKYYSHKLLIFGPSPIFICRINGTQHLKVLLDVTPDIVCDNRTSEKFLVKLDSHKLVKSQIVGTEGLWKSVLRMQPPTNMAMVEFLVTMVRPSKNLF